MRVPRQNPLKSSPSSTKALETFAFLFYAAAVLLALFRIHPEMAGGFRLRSVWPMLDFFSNQYYPVRALLDGRNPHNAAEFLAHYPVTQPYLPYSPINLLLHLPFGLLDPALAGAAYFALTALLTVVLAHTTLRLTGSAPNRSHTLLLATAVLLSRPGHTNLVVGQVAVLLTLAAYLIILDNSRSQLVGALGIAVVLLKVTFGVPLALLLYASGRRRAVLLGVAVSAAVNLPFIALFAVHEGGLGRFIQTALHTYVKYQDRPEESYWRVDLSSTLIRFLERPISPLGQVLLAGVLLLSAAIVLHRLSKYPTLIARDISIGIICLTTLLVGYHMAYDLVLAMAPFAAVASRGVPASSNRIWRSIFLLLFTIPAFNWFATGTMLSAWHPPHYAWLMVSSLNGLCLGVLAGGYLLLGVRYLRQLNASSPSPSLATSSRHNFPAGPLQAHQ
jgi:hypothetical protein